MMKDRFLVSDEHGHGRKPPKSYYEKKSSQQPGHLNLFVSTRIVNFQPGVQVDIGRAC
jgi:hypothetical protein